MARRHRLLKTSFTLALVLAAMVAHPLSSYAETASAQPEAPADREESGLSLEAKKLPLKNGKGAKKADSKHSGTAQQQQAKSAGARAGASSQTSQGLALPVRTRFAPLFASPGQPAASQAVDFVMRDPNIMATLDLSPELAAARANQIRQMETDFRLQQRGSPQALQMGTSLLRMHEEQALYLENLRALGIVDKNYPDLNHFIKVTRSSLINQLNVMLKQFPKGEAAAQWRATSLVSRIRIGDPSVTRDALAFVKNARGEEATRVILTGIAWDFVGNKAKSVYGTIADAERFNTDDVTRAVFQLFRAEQAAQLKQNAKALSLYEEAAKKGMSLRRPDGKLGPIASRSAARMIQLSLAANPDNVDPEMVATLQGLGLPDAARYYVEQIALKNVAQQPRRATTQYADILNVSDTAPNIAQSVEFRILDIEIAARDIQSLEGQWDRISKISGALAGPEVDARIGKTQSIGWQEVTRKSTPDSVERFVRMHDFFVTAMPSSYALNEGWTLKAIEGLSRIQRNSDVAARADALANSSKKTDVQLSALRFSARAREKILGVGQEPSFIRSKKLQGGAEVATAYVLTLDRLTPMVKGEEVEKSAFQAGYIVHLNGDEPTARTRFETSVGRHPRSKFAPPAVSFLLDIAQSRKDFPYTEKVARLAESKQIKPSKKEHADLRGIIEVAVYSHANQLAEAGQHEQGAARFVAFQKEFPRSKNADNALNLAAKSYQSANRIEDAVSQMESLLTNYPDSPFAFASRWQAAELSKGIGQLLRAANHYEAFAKSWKKEGAQRNAWLKAAEMHKGLGRYANAIADFEIHLKETASKGEKVKVAKEIADMQSKYGKTNEALAALDRVITISKDVDQEIWARAQMIEIFQRQGQEANARKSINRVMELKPNSEDGFKTIAKAKFALAKLDAKGVRELEPMQVKNLKKAVSELVSAYDRTKGLFLASCEVPGLEWCSVGYYETSRLAEDCAKKLLEIELPPTLDPKEVGPIRALVSQNSERMAQEAKSFAAQAEQALGTGAPDADTADRIRAYAQQQKGESGRDVPLK